jgi:hypothetical protein
MKTVRIVRGCVHVPSESFAPTTFDYAGLAVPSGDRSVRVVKRGETVTLADAEADKLITARRAIEVEVEIHSVDVQADGYVASRQHRGEVK